MDRTVAVRWVVAAWMVGVLGAGCEGEVGAVATDPSGGEQPVELAGPARSGQALVVAAGPDLRVSDVTLQVSAVLRNGTAPVQVTVCNGGTASTPASRLDVLVSTDATITSADSRVGTDTVPALAPGACLTRTVSATFAVASRSYLVAAWADPLDAVGETVESNNVRVGPSVYVGSRADLTIAFGSAPATAAPRATFQVTGTACNLGSAAATSVKVDARLSTDPTITSADTRVGTATVATLAAGACQAVTVTASGPATGERYLGLLIDPANAIAEVSESNNAALGGLFAIGTGPDLAPASLTALVQGSAVATVTRVCNRGTAPAPASALRLVLSLDAAFDAADAILADAPVPALAAAACADVALSSSAPAVAPATYRVLARVDPTNAVPELVEGDNTLAGGAVTLGPNLALVDLAVAPSGAEQAFTGQVCNRGTLPAAASTVRLRVSVDQVLDAADAVVAQQALPALAAGACAPLAGTFVLPALAPGQYFFVGRADDDGVVAELDEADNLRVTPGQGLGADLTVEAVNGWMAGGLLSTSVRVCNRGTVPTPPAVPMAVALYLSDDAVRSPDDVLVVARPVEPLAVGACVDLTTYDLHVPPGVKALLAVMDEANLVAETDEGNNTLAGPLLRLGADLAWELLEASFADQALQASGRVCNRGNLPAADGWLVVGLSATPPFDGLVLGLQVDVGPLAPGACADASGRATVYPWQDLGGPYQVVGWVLTSSLDLDPSNDRRLGPQVQVGADLALTSLTASFADQALQATAQVCNQGNMPLAASWLQVELLAPPSFVVGALGMQLDVVALAPGACAQVSGSVAVQPWTDLFGVYQVVGRAQSAALDLDPSNNERTAPQLSVGPDLALTSLGATFSNQVLQATARVCNQGNMPLPASWVAVELDATPGVTSPAFALQLDVVALAPGACATASAAATVPPYVTLAGIYQVLGRAQSTAPDLDPSNNQLAGPQLTIGADLAITSFQASLDTRFRAAVRVCNLGAAPAAAAALEVSLAAGSGPAAPRTFTFGLPVPALAPGACSDATDTWQLPYLDLGYGYPAGLPLYAGVTLLPGQPDVDSTNHWQQGPQVLVGPDVAVTFVSGAVVAEQLEVTALMCNRGNLLSWYPAGAARLITPWWVKVDWQFLVSADFLAPGQCKYATGRHVLQASETTGWFGVTVTYVPMFGEPNLDTSNDVGTGASGLGIGPDLAVAEMTASFVVDQLQVRTRVCNRGNLTGGANLMGSLRTMDAQWLEGFQQAAVPSLAPGQCQDVLTTLVPWPWEYGTWDLFGQVFMTGGPPGQSWDLDPSNDQLVGQRVVIGPDLAVSDVTWSSASATVSASWTVCNQGPLWAADSLVQLWLSPTPTVDPDHGARQVLAVSGGALAPGQCTTVSGSHLLTPADQVASGVLYAVAEARVSGQLGGQADPDLSDNVAAGPPLLVEVPGG